MDKQQAKEILSLYRPGTTDAADPRMAEAMDFAQRDPELAAWFEQHCAVYLAIRGKLKAISVPADLKRRIVVEHMDHARIIPLPSTAKLLLAAAAIVLISAIMWVVFNTQNPNTFLRYRDHVARSLQHGYSPVMQAGDQTQIREYFRANEAPADYVLSRNLQKLPGEGGLLFPWNNHQVEMLCLNASENGAEKGRDIWIFMMKKSFLHDPPNPGKTYFATIGHLQTASWTDSDKVYVLAAAGTQQDLEKYLQ
jgi:hypothetical protein